MSTKSIAKKYFELSNAQDFNGIKDLFADILTYTSPALGRLTNRDEIIEKQKEFYKAHKNVRWHDKSYKEIDKGTVIVDFECENQTKDGNLISWSGLEYISVKNGKISGVEIKPKP